MTTSFRVDAVRAHRDQCPECTGTVRLAFPEPVRSRLATAARAAEGPGLAGVPGRSLSATYPAARDSVASARHALVGFAASAGAAGARLDAIGLAASEALTNVVKHAYGGRPGRIHVAAAAAADELWVLIADDGRGLRPQLDRSGLGLGLTLIAMACEELAIVKRDAGGTELRMRFDLTATEASTVGQGRRSVASAAALA